MRKRYTIPIVGLLLLAIAFLISALAIEPGSQEDPLISKSYIDEQITSLQTYIDGRLGQTSQGEFQNVAAFVVVPLKNGQKLLAGDGCEMIIRQGRGQIVSTEKGGICDSTDGVDLANGTAAPPNHLLIVPIGDGRGILAQSEMLIMVKGGYTIED